MLNEKKISKSGGITIPSHVRRDLGVEVGDRYEIVPQDDGNILLERTQGSCFVCKNKEDLLKVYGLLICKICAGRIAEKLGGQDDK